MKIIDTHVHIFPDKIASRTLDILSGNASLVPSTDGTLFGTLKKFDEWNVDGIWAQSIATNAHQMQSVNNFAASLNSEKVWAFGSVFPHAKGEALTELIRVHDELKINCIKLHPEYQKFDVADEIAFPLYEYMERNNMLLIFHAGKDAGFLNSHLASVDHLKAVHSTFPKLKMICAHLGGWNDWDDVYNLTAGSDIYFDTATLAGYIDRDLLKRIILKHPPDHLLFASDTPWSTPKKELELLNSIGLSDELMDMICHGNAEKLRAEIETANATHSANA